MFFILFLFSSSLFSQVTDSVSQNIINPKSIAHFGGAVTVTNKGISTIPTFTLGKPAIIFDLSMGKGKFNFDPQFRFSLKGQPWSFIFWGRYNALRTKKFVFNVGVHPAISFKTTIDTTSGDSKEVLISRRYLAGEIFPNYIITKNISLGIYYLYSYCLEEYAVKNTNYLSMRSTFSNIRLTDKYFMGLSPQVYYLKLGDQDGFYFSSVFNLSRKNFPVLFSALINIPMNTNITSGQESVWNVSLIYGFNKEYVKRK